MNIGKVYGRINVWNRIQKTGNDIKRKKMIKMAENMSMKILFPTLSF